MFSHILGSSTFLKRGRLSAAVIPQLAKEQTQKEVDEIGCCKNMVSFCSTIAEQQKEAAICPKAARMRIV